MSEPKVSQDDASIFYGPMLDPRFKTTKDTAPEFTESMLDMESVFEFELMDRWVPKDPEAV